MSQSLRIAVAGASGRMGKMLIETVLAADDAELVGALDIAGSPAIGTDPGASWGISTGIQITDQFEPGLAQAKYLIDFTRPEGTLNHARYCA